MKKTITLTLTLVMILACNMWAISQETIADETTLTEMKSGFKVETDNDTIFKMTPQAIKPRSYTVTFKKDRYGEYAHCVLYYRPEELEKIKKYFAKL